MATQEIAKAIENLKLETLQAILSSVNINVTPNREELLKEYQKAVMDNGLKLFVKRMKFDEVKNSCNVLKVDDSEADEDTLRKNLESAVLENGIDNLLSPAPESLLKSFCETLGLKPSGKSLCTQYIGINGRLADKDTMTKQIADEVMLTGMENFLNQLSVELLKNHCLEMNLEDTGEKKDLVER
jgi:hypothetical protein